MGLSILSQIQYEERCSFYRLTKLKRLYGAVIHLFEEYITSLYCTVV